MGVPDTEASMIFMRSLRRLHEDTLDLMRIGLHDVSGTFEGACYNATMKHFLHHNAVASLGSIGDKRKVDELPKENIWVRTKGWLENYLDVLPDTPEQAVTILRETLDRDRINALIMSQVPADVESSLRMLSGGRWQLEILELRLVQSCERSI